MNRIDYIISFDIYKDDIYFNNINVTSKTYTFYSCEQTN